MLYCRKNEFFYYYTYELWLSEKKLKKKSYSNVSL